MHIKYNYTSYDESGAATPTKFIHQSCFVFCWGCHEYTEIRGIIFLTNVPSPNNRIMARRKHNEHWDPWKVNNCCCLPIPLLSVCGREVPCVLNVCSGRILSFYVFFFVFIQFYHTLHLCSCILVRSRCFLGSRLGIITGAYLASKGLLHLVWGEGR